MSDQTTGLTDEFEGVIFPHTARVIQLTANETLLALAKKRAPDPTIFDERAPYFWANEMSNGNRDSYYTRMGVSTLRNYAKDASDGLPFQNNHRERELGFGRSLTGQFDETALRVVAEMFTIPGLRLNDVSTDDLIAGMRSGITRDVSTGFFLPSDPTNPARYDCSICGLDMLRDRDCWHVPGMIYEEKAGNNRTVKKLCEATIEHARAVEVSAAWKGSTPSATVLKAQRMAESGHLLPEQARLLEQRYRSVDLKLPAARRVFAVGNPQTEDEGMSDQIDFERQMTEVRAALKRAGIADDKPAPEAIRGLHDALKAATDHSDLTVLLTRAGVPEEKSVTEGIQHLSDELTRLRPLADDGTKYRKSVVDEAIAEGTRAMGKDFAPETQRALLEKLSIEDVKAMTANWKRMGDALFPGGRSTEDEPETKPAPVLRSAPNAAYVA